MGACRDGTNLYRAGDFSEGSLDTHHQIEVTDDGPCLSLIARRGPMRVGPIMAMLGRFLGV
jgi:anti-sigma factor ChrR (cupin superfamily)